MFVYLFRFGGVLFICSPTYHKKVVVIQIKRKSTKGAIKNKVFSPKKSLVKTEIF